MTQALGRNGLQENVDKYAFDIEKNVRSARELLLDGKRRECAILINQILHADFQNRDAWEILYRLVNSKERFEVFQYQFTQRYYPDKLAEIALPSDPGPKEPPTHILEGSTQPVAIHTPDPQPEVSEPIIQELDQPVLVLRCLLMLGKFGKIPVQLDGQSIGELRDNSEIRIPVSLGKHTLTSEGFLHSNAYPLEIQIDSNCEVYVTLDYLGGNKNKYLFFCEPFVPSSNQLEDEAVRQNRLVFDLNSPIFIRFNNPWIYFDLPNSGFPRPLRFVINQDDKSMKVFANWKSPVTIYDVQTSPTGSLKFLGIKVSDTLALSFYRSFDGELLGHLMFDDDGDPYIVSKQGVTIATIDLVNLDHNWQYNMDHRLQTAESTPRLLAVKEWHHYKTIEFKQFGTVWDDQQEVIMLAFYTYAAIFWRNCIQSGIAPQSS